MKKLFCNSYEKAHGLYEFYFSIHENSCSIKYNPAVRGTSLSGWRSETASSLVGRENTLLKYIVEETLISTEQLVLVFITLMKTGGD